MTLRIGSLFSGFGGLDNAITSVLDAEVVWVCDNDPAASKVLATRYPGIPNLGDITAVDWDTVKPVDIICGGSPCFPAGTLIDTEDGYRPIETIRVGDRIRTHRRRYRPVVQLMRRQAEDTITVKAMGTPAFVTTREHPFWIRRKDRVWNNDLRRYDRTWGAPEWVEAGLLDAGCFLGLPLDERDSNVPELGPELAYLIGRWLGDGWIRDSKRTSAIPQGRRGSRLESRWWNVFICCAHDEANDLEQRITAAGYASGRLRQRTVTKFRIGSKSLVKLLTDFGRGAGGKRIPGWVYRLPVEDQRQLWQGWVDSDGSVQADGQVRVTTVSVELAHGMARVARNAYHRAVSVHHSPMPETCVIEGRTVNQRDQYQVCLPTGNREAFVEDGWVWVPVRSVTDAPAAEVFNFGVEEDESYTAWGFAVHNCQDISAAGRRLGMLPGTRSGLWTSMANAIAALRPSLVVFENVRGLTSAPAHCDVEFGPWDLGGPRDGEPALRALGRVLGDLADIGFDAEWRSLRASDIGAPHHRYRIFLAAWPAADTEDFRRQRGGQHGDGGLDLRTAIAALVPHADGTAGGERRVAAPGQAEGGRARPNAGGRGGAPADVTGRPLPGALGATPRATDGTKGGPNQRGSSGDLMLPSAVAQLLPTPTVADARNTANFRPDGTPYGHGCGMTPTDATRLLPTPTAADSDRTSLTMVRGNPTLLGAVTPLNASVEWGPFADAIARWEQALDVAAPDPKDAKGRLAPEFVEWMQGLPAGWVTDVPGLSRNDVLRILGNGVVSQQCAAALAELLPVWAAALDEVQAA